MNKKALAFALLCMLSSCEKPDGLGDPKFIMLSIEGFKFQMTPRVANLVAEENGWALNSSVTLNTFDDIIEDTKGNKFGSVVLERGYETIELEFKHGRLRGISNEKHILTAKQAKDLFESYKIKFPDLKPDKDNSQAYSYKYNESCWILVHLSEASDTGVFMFMVIAYYDYGATKD